MVNRIDLKQEVLQLFEDQQHKDELILKLFQYQLANNPLFYQFVKHINGSMSPNCIEDLSYLPISFYKTHTVKSGTWDEQLCFRSSGTSQSRTSRHYIREADWYNQIAGKIFKGIFGDFGAYKIYGLLPSYLVQGNSSLVHMVNYFMDQSGKQAEFYLDDFATLSKHIEKDESLGVKSILFGVSYALLDYATEFGSDNPYLSIIETGGMKGRAKEMVRQELHKQLQDAFPNANLYSEYGMTELLSQAYAFGMDFQVPPSMSVCIRELNDPKSDVTKGKTGLIHVIDLANIDSIAFIATDDLGKMKSANSFEVLGRVDNSMIRGCNLLYTSP